MDAAKRMKKNVTLEVRLPDEAKSAFMMHCKDEGRTASDAIRWFIDWQLESSPRSARRRPSLRITVAALLGIAIGAGATAPLLAHPLSPSRASFQSLDRNHDGVLSFTEYQTR